MGNIIIHHDVLRFKYSRSERGDWKQEARGYKKNNVCQVVDLSKVEDGDLEVRIREESEKVQSGLNIEKGELIKACIMECGGKVGQRVLIVIHHLVVDGVSWRVVFEDIERIYGEVREKKVITFLDKTHSYKQWVNSLEEYSKGERIEGQIEYWKRIEEKKSVIKTVYEGGCKEGDMEGIVIGLDEEETKKLLYEVASAYKTEINDILLTGMVLSIGDWSGEYKAKIYLEGHGREEHIVKEGIELSRSMGWYTSVFPIYLELREVEDIGDSIKEVKESLREIPDKGIGYGVIKYMRRGILKNEVGNKKITFNYMGQWDNTLKRGELFEFANEDMGRSTSERNESSSILSINGEVRGRRIQFYFAYSNKHYKREDIDELTKLYKIFILE